MRSRTGRPSSSRDDTNASASDGCSAIISSSSAPTCPRAPTMPMVCGFGMSGLQRGGPRAAVFDGVLDFLERFEAVPVHVPLLAFQHAVRFVHVELVDGVVGPRAPEQLRRFRAHHLPRGAAEAFALRIF